MSSGTECSRRRRRRRRHSPQRFGALAQDLANPLWRWLMDGCNLNRDTVAAIRAAGFTLTHVGTYRIVAPGAPPLPLREVHGTA